MQIEAVARIKEEELKVWAVWKDTNAGPKLLRSQCGKLIKLGSFRKARAECGILDVVSSAFSPASEPLLKFNGKTKQGNKMRDDKKVFAPMPYHFSRLMTQKGSRKGSVYVIEAVGLGGIYKIGQSQDIKNRMRTIQASCPVGLKLVIAFEMDDVSEVELHNRFKAERLHGEWFRLSDDDVASIKRYEEKQ